MVTLEEYESSIDKRLRQVTLCLLVRNDEALLAMKKRGFGEGKYNGVGGKRNDSESIVEAAIRETKEEIGVVLEAPKNVGSINFYFLDVGKEKDWNQNVIVFLADKWIGMPKESEEMKPEWFKINKLPYDRMWPADRHWMPSVFEGKYVTGSILFDRRGILRDFRIKAVSRERSF